MEWNFYQLFVAGNVIYIDAKLTSLPICIKTEINQGLPGSFHGVSSHSHLSPGESMRDSFPLIKGIIPGGWKEYTAIVSFNMVARGLAERRGREKFFAETKLVEGGGGSRQRRKRIGGKRKGRNR